ncbi:Protein of unknown function [Pyronema omphalodes CBS 100304]|uniref:Uncharacterized protein n=1 Tax=Pyronema omphalodes (strain CBS 100304) TaxID=1076935 RepID=U4LL14_PYROM|nr:Protein of unknown function [Pyronema omphalodes CBS 100304]
MPGGWSCRRSTPPGE